MTGKSGRENPPDIQSAICRTLLPVAPISGIQSVQKAAALHINCKKDLMRHKRAAQGLFLFTKRLQKRPNHFRRNVKLLWAKPLQLCGDPLEIILL